MHSAEQQPPPPVVTSEELLKVLGMNLSWGNTPILRLPTVFNPSGTTQSTQATPWPQLAAPTPIHPNNPLPGLLDNNLLANLLRLPQPMMPTELKAEPHSPHQQQPTHSAAPTFNLIPEQNRIAALKLQEKIRNEAGGQVIFSTPDPTPESSPPSTFTRAPGHGASEDEAPTPESLVCPECGFACTSKFHFNSHMNTHGDYKCKICDYKTRTEGRVLKHMREAHTTEEQIAFGVDPNGSPTPSVSTTPGTTISSSPSSSTKEFSPDSGEENVFQIPMIPHLDLPTVPAAPKTPRKQKPKRYQCKHCDYVSSNKNERYEHSKTHIPIEKQLCCPQCEFVTEYKHHLEYHIRNHYGSKPFTCEKCNYTCVNKSMLNSHLKSHSTDYQFKCQDCTYATKYCHSLKLHLRKYSHRRLMGEDDLKSPDASPIAANGEMRDADEAASYAALLNPAQLDASNTLSGILPCTMCGFQTADVNEQLHHNLQHLLNGSQGPPTLSLPTVSVAAPGPLQIPISSANLLDALFASTSPSTNTVLPVAPPVTVEVKVEVNDPEDVPMEEPKQENNFRQACLDQLSQIQELQHKYRWQCDQCQVSFMDEALCNLHLQCHGIGALFKCAFCAFSADNALHFNQHIVQGHGNNVNSS